MTLVNCKISNYPIGEPDNQDPINNIAMNSSVNLNTLPSHVKLVIKPNNDTESSEGFYAVRAVDFWIGGRENYYTQYASGQLDEDGNETGSAITNPYYQTSASGSPPDMMYEMPSNLFGQDPGDHALDSDSIIENIPDEINLSFGQLFTNVKNWGLGYSPYATPQNLLSIEKFGSIGNSSNGRVYNFHGLNPSEDGEYESSSEYPVVGEFLGTTFTDSGVDIIPPGGCDYGTTGACNLYHFQQYVGWTFPPDAADDGSLVSSDGEFGKGVDRTTSWTYVNRVMICDSMENLGEAYDEDGVQIDENYDINNEVYVWIEFKDNYMLSATPGNNPELWDIKVDIDGGAKFIET